MTVLTLPAPKVLDTAHGTYVRAVHAQLVRSPLNVRRQRAPLDDLVASIAAHGVIHNLIGVRQLANGIPTGLIEIVAGERRLDAVALLIAHGRLPADYELVVLLVSEAEAVSLSLAENLGRTPMHPADVCDALLALARRGVGVDDLALSFGLPPLEVRRRLKLANVAPRFFALYREDRIGFDLLAALAVSDDHAAQEQAWDSLPPWQRSAHALKRLLTAHQVDARHDPVARYVGVAAYRKAGGPVDTDLFAQDGGGYLGDPALLDRLASAKLEKLARQVRAEGWQWVQVCPRVAPGQIAQFGKVRTVRRLPTEAEAAEMAACAARLAADGEAAAEARAAQSRLEAALLGPDPEQQARAGAIVTIDGQGAPCVLRGLLKSEDMPARRPAPSSTPPKERPAYSARLTRALGEQRTLILQAVLQESPRLALAVLVHDLLRERGTRPLSGVAVRTFAPLEPVAGAAAEALAGAGARVTALLPPDGATLPALAALDLERLAQLLALCLAPALDLADPAHDGSYRTLAACAQLDVHRWWTVDAACVHRLPCAAVLAAVQEAVDAAAAVPLETLPRAQLDERAATVLAEARWLPPVLRRG